MRCIVPKYSGFCFDVSVAVKTAYENTYGDTYMYGEVVNNPVVVKDLESKGLTLVHDLDSIPKKAGVKVLVRAHGVPESTVKEIARRGYKLIDKTCPRVKRVHNTVINASNRGMDVILVGTPGHPEINGVLGWAKTKVVLIQDLEQAKAVIPSTIFTGKGVSMVAQTTHNKKKYEEIYAYCSSLIPNIEFHDTICDATAKRQSEIRYLARLSDGFIVVGGKASSNVSKLYEIASEHCKNIQQVETVKDVDLTRLSAVETLIVAGGASTPDVSVNEIVYAVKNYCASYKIPFETGKNLFFHNW
ncbi:MAG: 4-hydroxy-3-methylbut-2-enyl diphosphate reductase [Clostridiales bacterium]|nr:4-hydroxy-3-methylbut-2-enyl diphosphate reductase [Clostridiales bacterium]